MNAEDDQPEHVHAEEGQGARSSFAVLENIFTGNESIFLPVFVFGRCLDVGLFNRCIDGFLRSFFHGCFIAHGKASCAFVTKSIK